MPGIPLCRASQIQPFASWLEEHGVPARPLLRDAGLPISFREVPDRWVPELPIWSFCENAARSQGIEDFGLRVGLGTDVAEIGTFGKALRTATTLRVALETFLRDLNKHSSCGQYGLRQDGVSTWFWRTGIPGLQCDPVEQYVVGLMAQIVRLAAGPRWAPKEVALQASELPGELAAETFAETRILLGAPLAAMRFPSVLLATPLRSAVRDGDHALAGFRFEQPPENLVDSLKLGLESALPHGSPGLRWAAHAANMSPRTLQRRLAEIGASWERLVDQTRFDTARRLLETTDLKLGDVAREVGYSEPANFSRAFQRWAGVAPSRYRPEE